MAEAAGVQEVLDAAGMTANDLAELDRNGFELAISRCKGSLTRSLKVCFALIVKPWFLCTEQQHLAWASFSDDASSQSFIQQPSSC